ncbi:hypothetical protein [Oceanispirochaeta sp. M2]|uniref:hypothetical protein n=1 Tax=Oceanispirochaeta sp. M2 TaxID=2735869 RepID=UPI001551E49C|nr:hypothetical protein [Oceanispirochaeta sp. M2]MBF9018485.1 hypothetical protein [Oceanispirochaeta sp. M2]
MKFTEIVDNFPTQQDKKRIASPYVIDYRNLNDDQLSGAIIKTAPQYYNEENVRKTLTDLIFHPDRNIRILHQIILKTILLNKDDFMLPQQETDQAVIDYEQEIVKLSNEEIEYKSKEKNNNIDLFKFILEAAWERNDDISPDEKNLIEKLKNKLNITEKEYQILEAQLAYFPKKKNEIHLRDEIKKCRQELQSEGLLLSFRSNDKIDYDVIPEEIGKTLRVIWGIEIKYHGYFELVQYKSIRNKNFYHKTIEQAGVYLDKYANMEDLQETIVNHIRPSILLGGYSPRDGLDSSDLSKWCKELSLVSSGQKSELISRIVDYYDQIKDSPISDNLEDPRVKYYEYFCELASRNLTELRKQNVIKKDLECEHYFEQGTYYIFEQKLGHRPLQLTGTEHPDGILSYKDKLILWDNKSKETSVNLKDHIKQFDRYITSSSKPVATFLVIGPSFTEESVKEARMYQIKNDVQIAILTASDLINLANNFSKKNDEDPFPLANFIQSGLIDTNSTVY